MLGNDGKRMAIVLRQKERFDYSEFLIECETNEVDSMGISEWAQKVGMLSAAIVRWPSELPYVAYQNLVYEMNAEHAKVMGDQRKREELAAALQQQIPPEGAEGIATVVKKDCCGGGKVV